MSEPPLRADPRLRWRVRGTTVLHRCDWLGLELATVDLPSGRRIAHHVVRVPRPAVGVVVDDGEGRILMLWRHRFIPDVWTYEIPAGRVEAGEAVEAAGRREVLEETGWRVGTVTVVADFHPSIGLSDQRFVIALGSGATRAGDPSDRDEAGRVLWLPAAEVQDHLRGGRVRGALSMTALLWAMTFGPLAPGAPAGGGSPDPGPDARPGLSRRSNPGGRG